MAEQQTQTHAGSVTSGPKTPDNAEPESAKATEEKSEKKTTTTKTKKVVGQFEYIGQDDRRFLFQDRESKKCYTVDKSLLTYRGEGGFREGVLALLQK